VPALSINDVTVTEGNAGTTTASFTVSLSAPSASTVTASYATADGTATGSGAFSSTGAIAIPSIGDATPYPSTIAVSGTSGTITKITATLRGFTHTYTSDVDILLVGPGGQSVVLMSDTGSSTLSNGLNLTFDDSAASSLPVSALSSGTFKPTNLEGSETFDPPAPAGGYGSALSVFNGTSAEGTWSLYVMDDSIVDSGSILGWTLSITTTSSDYVGVSGTVTFTPGSTSQPVSVTVNGDAISEANETFFLNLTNPVNASILDGQGLGTINNDDGAAPPANVVATASAATAVGLTWTAASGAPGYRVYRSSNAVSYSLVGSPSGTSFSDTTAAADTAYLYKVRSFAGSESADSNIDLATTVIFTDDPISIGATSVKVVHFTQLLTAVNAVRTLAGLGTVAFTGPLPATNINVARRHVLDLRGGLDPARSFLGLAPLTYTDTTITAGITPIRAAHLTELRNGVK